MNKHNPDSVENILNQLIESAKTSKIGIRLTPKQFRAIILVDIAINILKKEGKTDKEIQKIMFEFAERIDKLLK